MRLFYVIATLMVLSAPLSACNTVHGFGEDLEQAGQSLQK